MANIITELHLEMSANWYVSKKLNSVGRVGENTVTKLIIEPTEILDGVTYEIEIMSADGSKNVAELTIDGTELYLILTANMLTTSGITKMQVRGLFTDGSIKKSNIFELKVNRSISATEHYEEYAVTIFDQLVNECRDIIEGAESYVVRAETAAVNAEAYEQSASASASTATTAATTATTASTAAVSAKTSAESASAAAHISAETATTAASSASTSAANANTSATSAANSATSAATSATNAHNSEVNASTSETNASTSATEAAASAESIAASVAQINENTYRINDLEAIIAGYQLTDLPTGAIATVADGTALLMPSLKVGIEPQQDLHGYDHPWLGGVGKNKLHNVRSTTTINNITFSVNNDGSVFIAGGQTASDTSILNLIANNQNYYNLTDFGLNYNVDYIINGCPNGGDNNYRLLFRSGGSAANIVDNGNGANFNISSESSTLVWMPCIVITSGYTIPSGGLLFKPMIRLATETDATFVPYSNICPISGWTATNVFVSPTASAEDGTTYTIQFKDGDNPLTVYGGTLDVTTGELVVDSALLYADGSFNVNSVLYDPTSKIYYTIVKSKIGAPASNPLPKSDKFRPISSVRIGNCYITSNGKILIAFLPDQSADTVAKATQWFANNPTQFVYELATPQTYHLTPTQVRTLVGNNNIWADTGDIISGKYFKSLV